MAINAAVKMLAKGRGKGAIALEEPALLSFIGRAGSHWCRILTIGVRVIFC